PITTARTARRGQGWVSVHPTRAPGDLPTDRGLMPRLSWKPCAVFALALLAGCANLTARKVPLDARLSGKDRKSNGFRYYLPRPDSPPPPLPGGERARLGRPPHHPRQAHAEQGGDALRPDARP